MTDKDFKILQDTYKSCMRLRKTMKETSSGEEFEKARDEYEKIDLYLLLLGPAKKRDLKEELRKTISSISGGMINFNDKQLQRIIDAIT